MIRRVRIAPAVLCCLLASAPSTFAQTATQIEAEEKADDSAISLYQWGDPTSAQAQRTPGQPLSLDQAIALGLRNNLDVEVNRFTPYVGELGAEAAWGAYDPTFEGRVQYDDTTTRNTFGLNPVAVNTNDLLGGTAGIGALIPYWGAGINISFDGRRSTTNSAIQSLNPQYDSGLTIGGTVPLMRGLIWNQAWTQVKTSRLSYDADLDNFTTSVMDTVQTIISSYWNLVATKEQVRVAEKSLESNQALLDQTRTQYDVGVVSKVEVVQAEAGVANSEFNLIVAQNSYNNAQDALIAAVLGDRLQAATTLIFDPTDSPAFSTVDPIDLNAAVATAFSNRPELAAAQRRLDQGEIQLKFAKNQRLPQLDLNVSYRTAGTQGFQNPSLFNVNTGQPAAPGTINPVGPFPDTFDSYYTSGGPQDLRAMAVVSIPLGNISGRKNVSISRIQLRQANSQITQLKQQIIVNVRSAARGMLAAAQGVEAAERGRIAAEEQLRAEKIRLEHGESTPFDVLQRESQLVTAESQKIAALQSFRNSQATLERQQGTILDTWDVKIDTVRALEYADPLTSPY
jgi:outer membrane protein TolC